jgi:hypothetical protein
MEIDCVFDDGAIVEKLFAYLMSNMHIINFICSKNYKYCCSIIANIFYYHSNKEVKNLIAKNIFMLFGSSHVENDFSNKRSWIFEEFEQFSNYKSDNEKISFPLTFNFHSNYSIIYLSTKLLYDCINGPNPDRNSQNVIFLNEYSRLNINANPISKIHQVLLSVMVMSVIDNSFFFKYTNFGIDILTNQTQSTNISNSTYCGSQSIDNKLLEFADYFLIENQEESKSFPENVNNEYFKFLVILCFKLYKIIIKYFKRLAFTLYLNTQNENLL